MNSLILGRQPQKLSLHRKPAKRRPPIAPEQPWEIALWQANRGYILVYGERPKHVRYLQPGPGRRITGVECSDAEQQHVYMIATATAVRLDELSNTKIEKGHAQKEDNGHFMVK
jgi:hypothetical protein